MNYHKYIIVGVRGCTLAIIFDHILSHEEVAKNHTVFSAGFFDVDYEKKIVNTFGESTSLKRKSKKDDARFIERVLFLERN